ncbi:TPM domain-containing protein [Hymenobacter psoromatis]|uniref:TPM domain-containing protein n=1 Tax=Hymenobacter psoromatis TaxID=1484116 RepID=UPI001CBC15F5|nr:TPM domain-containing protein [Hymenobacter psoromatis]
MSKKPRNSPIPAALPTDEPSISMVGKIFRSLGCLGILLIASVFIAIFSTLLWNWASAGLAHLGAPHPAATSSGMPVRPAVYTPVVDAAGILTTNELRALSTKLQEFEHASTTQLVVVTVPSLNGNELADYAQQLYHSWGIGQRHNNNGLLVLVAMQEHGLRIQTGYGLEGAIPDATCERLITNVLEPAFKNQQYYDGLDAVTTQLIQLAQGETASFAPPADTTLSWGLVLLIMGLLLALLFRALGSEALWGWTALAGTGVGFSSSGSSSDSDSSSSSSSGDSWGGGDSGGGGASGSW